MSLVTGSSRFLFSILLFSILALFPRTAPCINPHATLDDLKKLEILCFVPSYLPKGFKLKSVAITYDEPGPDEGSAGRFPLYYLEYGDNHGGSFTVDSAREGIGDRNLMETERQRRDHDHVTLRPDVFDLHAERAGKSRPEKGDQSELGERRQHEVRKRQSPGASDPRPLPRLLRHRASPSPNSRRSLTR